jgi:hypothetical protein
MFLGLIIVIWCCLAVLVLASPPPASDDDAPLMITGTYTIGDTPVIANYAEALRIARQEHRPLMVLVGEPMPELERLMSEASAAGTIVGQATPADGFRRTGLYGYAWQNNQLRSVRPTLLTGTASRPSGQ